MYTTDVLIIGAGPTGLTLACLLQQWGISYRIIDENMAPCIHSKASTIQPRTLEIWKTMGILDAALQQGNRVTGITYYQSQQTIAHFNTQSFAAAYPFLLLLPQSTTEQLLNERLTQLGGKIERQKTFTTINTTAATPIVTLIDHTTQFSETLLPRYIVSCEGAHSLLRKTLQIPFEGETYSEQFLLADMDIAWRYSPAHFQMWLQRDGLFLGMPLGGTRWVMFAEYAPNTPLPDDQVGWFYDKMTRQLGEKNLAIQSTIWLSQFTINKRLAAQFSRNNLFLLGDAAHIHSPIGGQGLNLGVQDAFNLAWKLALVINHKASADLLTTYSTERRPAAQTVLNRTHKSTRTLLAKNKLRTTVRNTVIIPLLAHRPFADYWIRQTAQLDHYYTPDWRASITAFSKKITVGKPLPPIVLYDEYEQKVLQHLLIPNAFSLFVIGNFAHFSSDIPLVIHRFSPNKQPHLPKWAMLLVRPDGYIALVNHQINENLIAQYLMRIQQGLVTQ